MTKKNLPSPATTHGLKIKSEEINKALAHISEDYIADAVKASDENIQSKKKGIIKKR